MATELELTTKINTANSAQSLGELRKSLKDLIGLQAQVGAGSAEFGKLADAINKTEGKLGDLQDSFSTLKGSGVERLNASLGLLKEGLLSGDVDKASTAFKGLGAAMSAVPIFLLIEGVKALIDNWDKISSAFKNFAGIASAAEKEISGLTAELEKQKKVNETLFAGLENQIKILEAQGASEEKILGVKKQLTAAKIKEAEIDVQLQKAKIKDIILNDDLSESLYRATAATLRKMGKDLEADAIEKKLQADKSERLKEATDALRTDLINIENLKTSLQVEEIKNEKKVTDEKKKIRDDEKKEKEKQMQEDFDAALREQEKLEEFRTKDLEKQDKKKADEEKAKAEQDAKNEAEYQAYLQREDKRLEDEIAREKLAAQQIEAAKFQIAASGIQSIQGLSDLAFSIRQANTKKGSAEEEKSARKQFQINKALQIASATINGAQGILNAATQPSGVPIPYDIPIRVAKAVAIGATTAATIAKISATQFQSTGGGGGGTASNIGGGGSASTPGGGATIPNQTRQSTAFRPETIGQIGSPGGSNTPGNQTNVQPQVAVTEIARVSKKVRAVESMAKFG